MWYRWVTDAISTSCSSSTVARSASPPTQSATPAYCSTCAPRDGAAKSRPRLPGSDLTDARDAGAEPVHVLADRRKRRKGVAELHHPQQVLTQGHDADRDHR